MSMAILQRYRGCPSFYGTAHGKHGDICWMLIASVVQTGSPPLCVVHLCGSHVCVCVCVFKCLLVLQTTLQEGQLPHQALCFMFWSPSNLMSCLTFPGFNGSCRRRESLEVVSLLTHFIPEVNSFVKCTRTTRRTKLWNGKEHYL